MLYSIAGRSQNNTDAPIQGIVLDLGLDWVEQRGQSLPAHGSKSEGQQIELNAIVIPLCGSRRFLFTFDRTVPELPSGRFVPRIGVIRAEPVPSESSQ